MCALTDQMFCKAVTEVNAGKLLEEVHINGFFGKWKVFGGRLPEGFWDKIALAVVPLCTSPEFKDIYFKNLHQFHRSTHFPVLYKNEEGVFKQGFIDLELFSLDPEELYTVYVTTLYSSKNEAADLVGDTISSEKAGVRLKTIVLTYYVITGTFPVGYDSENVKFFLINPM